MPSRNSTTVRGFANCALLVCSLLESGCNNRSAPTATPGPRTPLPGAGGGTGNVGGKSIDKFITYGIWGDDIAILVLSDIRNGQGGGGRVADLTTYSGDHDSRDGRRIEWRCQTKNGKEGPVTFNGQNFELANGSLLLVTIDAEKTIVRQLKRDALHFNEDYRATLRDRLENDADIKDFFTDVPNPE